MRRSRACSTTHLLSQVPGPHTVTVLEVKYGGLGDIDTISQQGYQDADDSAEYPALGTVEQDDEPTPPVLATPQLLHPICVGDAIVNPVGTGELIVPDAFVVGDGELGLGHGVLAVCESLDEAVAPRLMSTMMSREAMVGGAVVGRGICVLRGVVPREVARAASGVDGGGLDAYAGAGGSQQRGVLVGGVGRAAASRASRLPLALPRGTWGGRVVPWIRVLRIEVFEIGVLRGGDGWVVVVSCPLVDHGRGCELGNLESV